MCKYVAGHYRHFHCASSKSGLITTSVRLHQVRKDGRLFAAACWDGKTRVFRAAKRNKTGERLAVLSTDDRGVLSVAFGDRGLLASGGKSGNVTVHEMYPRRGRS